MEQKIYLIHDFHGHIEKGFSAVVRRLNKDVLSPCLTWPKGTKIKFSNPKWILGSIVKLRLYTQKDSIYVYLLIIAKFTYKEVKDDYLFDTESIRASQELQDELLYFLKRLTPVDGIPVFLRHEGMFQELEIIDGEAIEVIRDSSNLSISNEETVRIPS